MLTLFAIPESEQEAVARNIVKSLRPGGTLVVADPLPIFGTPEAGRKFLRNVMRSAYQNNEGLTYLDVAILFALNSHSLLKIKFKEPAEMRAFFERVGLRSVGREQSVYYGNANLQEFIKPY